MKLSDFNFELPDELIARFPAEQRDASRLLHLDASGQVADRQFADLVDLVGPNDCLIFNDTKVIPARLYGQRASGGKVELLIERIEDEFRCLSMVKSSNRLAPGSEIFIGDYVLQVIERAGQFYRFTVKGESTPMLQILEQQGHMPLPPYIDREDSEFDAQRYQTIYAKNAGAVAAPTAGLHFTDDIFNRLQAKGVQWDFVTLHVGSGTFAPVRVESITEHQMHSEFYSVPNSVVELIKQTKARGGRVVAVGTTSVRCLESAAAGGDLQASAGETDIFIYPGYQFEVIDALVTNFHLPESTLIMLVSALATQASILQAYQHAVAAEYRFFSYGDAMFIEQAIAEEGSTHGI
ncbi:MAG: tRNA preQ1(34) S-adenosylmethionine ribosyltransferase-isomerase QueA [Gammaproteobacteria bacterium]|nr:tRNA preQ1(34) S-adenosylmethionine ribosyltransferase-isomerase QueA [Gammaproteobacteria bacterium]